MSSSQPPLGPFTLGINYPWVSCGHDFGPRPPQWGTKGKAYRARNYSEVEQELGELRKIGVNVARWWVLAGGVNYPVGEDPLLWAEVRDTRDGPMSAALDLLSSALGDVSRALPTVWPYQRLHPRKAEPPGLPDEFLADFEELLSVHQRTGMKVLPSLLSFEFFQPLVISKTGIHKRGRSEFVFGAEGANVGDAIDAFLDRTLAPLLQVSRAYASSVFAWEVINEPEWVVCDGPVQIDRGSYGTVPSIRWIQATHMSELLLRATQRITEAGFVASVGFGSVRQPWVTSRAMESLRSHAVGERFVHQLHHYPTQLSDQVLHPASHAAMSPCVVGEFPTSQANGLDNVAWEDPELEKSESDPGAYLEARLHLIRNRGYQGAFPWSARSGDSRRSWDDSQKQQVQRFARDVGIL